MMDQKYYQTYLKRFFHTKLFLLLPVLVNLCKYLEHSTAAGFHSKSCFLAPSNQWKHQTSMEGNSHT